jgi:phage baseplate assembly protein W
MEEGDLLMSTRQGAESAVGFGVVRPFQRDRKADFAADGGEALVRSAVGQILGTVGASEFTQGEIPWRTELGSRLQLLIHQRNDAALQELARVYVVDALRRFEPRVHVKSVRASRERGENVLSIRLRYDLVASPGNTVLIPDVEQTVRV